MARNGVGVRLLASIGLYVGLVAEVVSVCGALGLLGDGGRQRLEDVGYAVVSGVVVYVCRRELLRRKR